MPRFDLRKPRAASDLQSSPKTFVFIRVHSWLRSTSSSMKNVAPAIFAPNGIGDTKPSNQAVLDWVHEIATLTSPENIFWCDGSNRENEFLLDQAMRQGVLLKL